MACQHEGRVIAEERPVLIAGSLWYEPPQYVCIKCGAVYTPEEEERIEVENDQSEAPF